MSDPSLAKKQLALLVACQALLYVNNVTLISVNALTGLLLSPNPLFATVPITTYIIGSSLTTLPASFAMARWGRRAGFMFGSLMGLAGTLLAASAMFTHSFVLLCLGTFVIGLYNAFAQYLRFAAVDVADAYDKSIKERAISWVLAGGLAGGIVGPEMSKLTREALPITFAGTYVGLAIVALIACLIASRLRIPQVSHAGAGPTRPLKQIAAQPTFIVAVLVGAVSYGAMNLLMTATPLAMKVCGFGYPDSADVIKWHVVAMFAPGFVTGSLVRRFGMLQIMVVGCLLMFGTMAIAHAGITYWHFWGALVLLGIGWNFMFVGATTLLTTTYSAGEKAKVQGVNDLAIWTTMITSSASSGALISSTGWTDLNLYALPAVAAALAAILWLKARRAPAAAAA
jgi:predicted MFS family arabinose efflux permease